jgi:hypothetical protein
VQPRSWHYSFAHQALPADVHRYPAETWRALTGAEWAGYLQAKWAAVGGPADAMPRPAGLDRAGDWTLAFLAMPEPAAPTEAHFVALAQSRNNPALVRCFVMEKGISEPGEPARAYVAEWREAMRIRHGDLPEPTRAAFAANLAAELGAAPPSVYDAYSAQPAAQGYAPAPYQSYPPAPYAAQAYPAGPSYPPATYPARPAPRPNSPGKWAPLAIVGAVVLLFGGFWVFRTVRASQIQEEYEGREKAARKAQTALDDARDRARKRIAEVRGPVEACRSQEIASATAALAKAKRSGALEQRAKAPRDRDALRGAIAYAMPDDKGATRALGATSGGGWVPETPWLDRVESRCGTVPAIVADIERELGETHKIYPYDSDPDGPKRQLDELVKTLDAAPRAGAAAAAKVVAVATYDCTPSAVALFEGIDNFDRRSLDSYTCDARIVWLSVDDGSALAAVSGRGAAIPVRDPGQTTTTSALSSVNSDTEDKALTQALDALKQKLAGLGG